MNDCFVFMLKSVTLRYFGRVICLSRKDYTKKTKTQDDTKNPEWNEELVFPRANTDSVKVQVKIFHQESLGKDK